MADEALSLRLEKYEGPLDLLLRLIEKNKINIYDIPIAEITEQYMAYLSGMEREDLDQLSEFLLMAATLLDIKARMLLPREVDQETGEEVDPRAELVNRLLEHKKYKLMAPKTMKGERRNRRKTMLTPDCTWFTSLVIRVIKVSAPKRSSCEKLSSCTLVNN